MDKIVNMYYKTELALPAGSLQCALYAFKGGADAVYLGMKKFSARKGAVNFSCEDLRKLKTFCVNNNKKFYITLNTLVSDEDISEILTMLKFIEYIGCDGVIVQDLGIAQIIKQYFPSIALHASTQLAVHNSDGVKVLQKLGFTRVVLARELSFDEVSKIRSDCPDIELKVFIHGAMCYGFSGMCMASEKLVGRSANCGECAQICRTWFTNVANNEDSWCFSMKDMCLHENVRKYVEIGIDSLKVEGRMKNAEYVYNTAKYYRAVLDGEKDSESLLYDNMLTSFSRETTEGFFNTKTSGSFNCNSMICKDFPSHRGIQIGKIKKITNGSAVVSFEKSVALRDGLLAINNGKSVGFSLNFIENKGQRLSFANRGEVCLINFPSEKFDCSLSSEIPLYCTSRHNANLEKLNENISLYKKKIDIVFIVNDDSVVINGLRFDCEVFEGKTRVLDRKVLEDIFSSSDQSYFVLGNLTLKLNTIINRPFIPLSVLKDIRRSFYGMLDSEFENQQIQIDRIHLEIPVSKDIKDLTVVEPLMLGNNAELPLSGGNIVLNNVAHIDFAQKHPDNNYYLGPFLYTKNTWAYSTFEKIIPNLIGRYEPNSRNIPLFISRVCYRHNSLGLSCKACTKNSTYFLLQNKFKYKVVCKNCLTYVYET